MEHGTTLLAILHVLAAVLLIVVVMIQDSKGGGMGNTFGSAGSQTLFGATGAANILVKATRILAVTFMVTCISLAYILTRTSNRSVVDSMPNVPVIPKAAPMTAPATAPSENPPTK